MTIGVSCLDELRTMCLFIFNLYVNGLEYVYNTASIINIVESKSIVKWLENDY